MSMSISQKNFQEFENYLRSGEEKLEEESDIEEGSTLEAAAIAGNGHTTANERPIKDKKHEEFKNYLREKEKSSDSKEKSNSEDEDDLNDIEEGLTTLEAAAAAAIVAITADTITADTINANAGDVEQTERSIKEKEFGELENYLHRLSEATSKSKSDRSSEEKSSSDDNEEEGAIATADAVVGIGHAVPDFMLTCMDGQEHKLSDFRGTKVMLCFYRFAYCPYCAYAISQIAGNYKKLAWATKLKIVLVFRTNHGFLKQGLLNDDALIPRLVDKDCYPFIALADATGDVGRTYQVESKGLGGSIADSVPNVPMLFGLYGVCNLISTTMMRELYNFPSTPLMLPSELLIDENGVLIDVLRAEKASETMNVGRIARFLLMGEAEKRASRNRHSEFPNKRGFDFSKANRRATQ